VGAAGGPRQARIAIRPVVGGTTWPGDGRGSDSRQAAATAARHFNQPATLARRDD